VAKSTIVGLFSGINRQGAEAIALSLSAGLAYVGRVKPHCEKNGCTSEGGPQKTVYPSDSRITLSNYENSSAEG
jgi:hypothetical protein